MSLTPDSLPKTSTAPQPSPSWRDSLAVYLQPRVLIVLLLGFSSGLPLALSGSTLLVWMRESGVDLGTIGLFALVGTPYTLKFLWAPLVDALHVPFFTRTFGRRRGWLVFSQLLLIVAILLLALTDPARSPPFVALGALLVAAMSSTQDIVVDAFRVESLPESEQAAAWRPTSRPIVSACWSRPRARCSSSAASKAPGLRAHPPGCGAMR
jgi:PAT family beta-lactamase induction signal transducer AmpG